MIAKRKGDKNRICSTCQGYHPCESGLAVTAPEEIVQHSLWSCDSGAFLSFKDSHRKQNKTLKLAKGRFLLLFISGRYYQRWLHKLGEGKKKKKTQTFLSPICVVTFYERYITDIYPGVRKRRHNFKIHLSGGKTGRMSCIWEGGRRGGWEEMWINIPVRGILVLHMFHLNSRHLTRLHHVSPPGPRNVCPALPLYIQNKSISQS